jgi:hypothetical protein
VTQVTKIIFFGIDRRWESGRIGQSGLPLFAAATHGNPRNAITRNDYNRYGLQLIAGKTENEM